jgi:glycosyltransferase involved in cell wall biosynthesis
MTKKQTPLVSIVTPSYNSQPFIEETILSVKNQTYPNIEHILMDGGSTDGTLDIIKKYDGSYNMRWVSEPDNGQSDAINKGWIRAKGEILGWLNSDDTYLPEAVATAVKFLNEHPDVSVVYGKCKFIDDLGEELEEQCQTKTYDFTEILRQTSVIPQPAAFMRREVLDEVGYLDTNLNFAMDFDFWIRTGMKLKIEYIPQWLANFRHHSGTKTSEQIHQFALDYVNILDKTFSNHELPEQIKALRRQIYSDAHHRVGANYYSERQMKLARKHLIKAIKLNPLRLLNSWTIIYLTKSFLGK